MDVPLRLENSLYKTPSPVGVAAFKDGVVMKRIVPMAKLPKSRGIHNRVCFISDLLPNYLIIARKFPKKRILRIIDIIPGYN